MSQKTSTKLQLGDKAYAYHKDVILCKQALTKNFLSLASRLYAIKMEKLYEVLDYPSFASYLASPEISISTTTAYSLIDIHRTFLLDLKVKETALIPIGRTKLERILPVVSPENYEDWLYKAESLSASDLTKEVGERLKKKIFEYKYTKHANMAFEGETKMEQLLEKKLDLREWYCAMCDNTFWTAGHRKPRYCSFCKETPEENGRIKYKDIG